MRTYIVSIGTSVITNYKRKYQYKASFDIDEVVEHLRKAFEQKRLEETSAEIKTLIKAGLASEDRVYLLSSDTEDGIIATHIIKNFLQGVLNNKNIIDYSIKGLQVDNSKDFREKGIKNLLSLIQKIKIQDNPSDFYIVISGGFKAVVPYLTVAGMLYDITVLYIFESTDELIELPPIPIEFNFSFIDSIEDMLLRMDTDGFLKKDYFEQHILGRTDKKKIRSLFIMEDDKIYPTEILYLLWQVYKFKYKN
jgi:putative CRISPR-associated protein (TIGR02619 family)